MKLIIVVPIYHEDFSFIEQISWRQLSKVLGDYPISIVVPQNLGMVFSGAGQYRIEVFPNEYFKSPQTYSRLLLSPSFYERFIDYEYMLIYQLDAFVFSDRLEYFCSLGYDYIGAPLPRWSNYWYSMKTRPGMAYIPFLGRVGNGGLSLRRIKSMLQILQQKERILSTHPLAQLFREQEDMFFTYCGTLKDGLNMPDINLARKFSVEMDVGHCYRNLEDQLPFGCHAWYKMAFPVWKKVIEREGYSFHHELMHTNQRMFRKSVLKRYLLERISRASNAEKARRVAKKIFSQKDYAVWGNGLDGKLLLMFLCTANVHVSCIFDNAAEPDASYCGIPVRTPEDKSLQRYKGRLLIGTASGEGSISKELLQEYSFRANEFIKFTVLLDRILQVYVEK